MQGDTDLRVIQHYIDRGRFPDEIKEHLLNADYYDRVVTYACILHKHNEDIDEKLFLHGFKKKGR